MVNTQSVALPGFDEELERADKDIARLSSRLDHQSADLQGQVRLLYRMFHRASLTGRMAHFEEVGTQLDDVLGRFGPKEDLCLLRANLDLRFHKLSEARRHLADAPILMTRVEARMLIADIDLQEGRYDQARGEYEALIAEDPTWDKFARLAHWQAKRGEIAESERLYLQAEDDLSAKQMLSYAWLEVQRGLLAFNSGNYAKAWWHYQRAESSYPGHWFTHEHMAELHAAEEHFDQAIEIMNSVVERTGKPEMQQALGEMHAWAGQKEEAQRWFDKAQRAYLESVSRRGVHYFHHLADLYAGAVADPHEALAWARRDIELRSNFSTQSTLAWALYRNQQIEEALSYMRLALSSGMRDAILYSTAAEIFEAAGDSSMSRQCTSVALEINPMHRRFRMHH